MSPARFLPVAALAATVFALVACTPSVDADTTPTTTPPAYGVAPEPGRTIEATSPAAGVDLSEYRIAVVLVADEASESLLSGVRATAASRGAELVEFAAATADADDVATALSEAVGSGADLVVGLGAPVVDVFSFETPQRLDQQFLVIGAQLAEPTANSTAVIWDGATSRGSAASPDDTLTETADASARASSALDLGIDSIRRGVTGVVIALRD